MFHGAMFGDDAGWSGPVSPLVGVDRGLPDGLVPVAFAFAERRMRLLDLRGVAGREQSFRHTVSRWRAQHPGLTTVECAWEEFLTAARRTPLLTPAGFLFNVARCGSTLLANMLAAPDGHVTLKESSTIGVLLREHVVAADADERRALEKLLAVTVPLYARLGLPADPAPAHQPSLPAPPRLFVKPHSLSTASAGALLRPFPRTPALLLYREPCEVVASMLAHAPYGGLFDRPHDEVATTFPALAGLPRGLSRLAFYASLWCSPVEAALSLPRERVLLVDYAELRSRPAATVHRLAAHFKIALTPAVIGRMLAATQAYAKDASGATPFDATGTHRRAPLDAAQRAEVSMVAGDTYARLLAWRRAQS